MLYPTTLLRAVLVTGLMAAAMPALAQDAPAAPTTAPAADAPAVAETAVPEPVAPETTVAEPVAAEPAAATPAAPAPAATAPAVTAPEPNEAIAPEAAPATEAVTATEAATAPEVAPEAPVAETAAEAATETAAETAPVANAVAEDVPPAADAPADDPATETPAPDSAIDHGLQGHDLSPMGMYRQADIVVKAVMIALVVAAILAWVILVAKLLQLAAVRAKARKVLGVVSRASDLESAKAALLSTKGLPATMVRAAGDEVAASQDIIAEGLSEGVKERVSSRLGRIEAAAGRKIGQGVGILASIGSVGPFVGLFGTVWGIMNAFIGIAESQTTNLAVVAPGIAEALLATAFGLVAAIPAVMIYNGLARATTGYRALLADLSAAIERLVSRDLDRAAIRAHQGN